MYGDYDILYIFLVLFCLAHETNERSRGLLRHNRVESVIRVVMLSSYVCVGVNRCPFEQEYTTVISIAR